MAENLRRNGGKSPCRWQTRADLCSNKAGFTKSIAYFPVVVGGANATIEVNYVVFTPQKTGRLLLQAACLLWV